MKSKVETFNL